MAWVKLDDQAPRNEKFLKAGPAASWLWVCGVAHCQAQLTDGFISASVLPMIGVARGYKELAQALVNARLWETVEGGYQVHDYLVHNQSREQVLAKRAEDAERKKQKESNRSHNRTPNGFRSESRVSRARVPSHPIPSSTEDADAPSVESSAHERIFESFRAHWKRVYGHESSLIVRPMEFSDLSRHLSAHPEAVLLSAVEAFFDTDDDWVRRNKHPLSAFLRDPLKYLVTAPAAPIERPRGCKHTPPCVDDAAHTKLVMDDKRRPGA